MSTPLSQPVPSTDIQTGSSTGPLTPGAAGQEKASTRLAEEHVDLPRGNELSEAAALELAKSTRVHLVVLAGATDSGKTTLLTTLYGLFQWGAVAGHTFAGSVTLPAFEERCFLSRRDSGNVEPDTPRTHYSGPEALYLHLKIRSSSGPRPFRDLLCTDVSGEMFEHARDSTLDCKEMTFLRRADHFVLMLDSEKGVQPDKRWGMVEDARALLRSCLDAQMLRANCLVNIVWSRFDYFIEKEANKEHGAFRAQVEDEFRETFGGRIPKLCFGTVAARPLRVRELGIACGVAEFLAQWTAGLDAVNAFDLFPRSFAASRESEFFARRHSFLGSNE